MKNKKRSFLLVILSLMLCFFVMNYQSVNASDSVKLNYSKKTLYIYPGNYGKSYSILSLSSGETAKWTSSNKSVVTVSNNGTVMAKSTGTTNVKAKVGNKSYTCKVTVKNASSIDKAKSKITVSSKKIGNNYIKVTLKNKTSEYEGYARYIVYFYKNGKKMSTDNFQNRIFANDSIVHYFKLPDGCTSYKIKQYEKSVYAMSASAKNLTSKNIVRYYEEVALNDYVKITGYYLENGHAYVTVNNTSNITIDTLNGQYYYKVNGKLKDADYHGLSLSNIPPGISSHDLNIYSLSDITFDNIEFQIYQAYSSIKCK